MEPAGEASLARFAEERILRFRKGDLIPEGKCLCLFSSLAICLRAGLGLGSDKTVELSALSASVLLRPTPVSMAGGLGLRRNLGILSMMGDDMVGNGDRDGRRHGRGVGGGTRETLREGVRRMIGQRWRDRGGGKLG